MTNFQGSVSSKVPKHSQIDLNILKRIEEVKELLKVDRVHVYEFHNGGHYVNGYSALKVSYTYEAYLVSITRIQKENLSIPIIQSTLHRYQICQYFKKDKYAKKGGKSENGK